MVLLELLVNWSDCIFEKLAFWVCKHAAINMSSVVEVNSAFNPSGVGKSSVRLGLRWSVFAGSTVWSHVASDTP